MKYNQLRKLVSSELLFPDIHSVGETQGLRHNDRSSLLSEEISGLGHRVGSSLFSGEEVWDGRLKPNSLAVRRLAGHKVSDADFCLINSNLTSISGV